MSEIDTTTGQAVGRRQITQRAAVLMAANVIATILSFAFPLVLVRVMSKADYGLYRQAFTILVSALGLLNLQVAVSVFYFSAREPGKKLQVAHNVIIFYSLIGALVFLLFMLWPGWVTLIFQGADLVSYVPLIGFAILCWLVSTNLEAVPIALGDVNFASVLIVLSQLTKAAVMISAALIFGTLTAILAGAVIQSLLQIGFTVLYIRRHFGHFLAPFDWPLFKAQIGNALPFGIGGIVAIVQNDMHNYFVSHHFDPAVFAVYAIGCFQLPILGMLSSSFANAFNPEMAKHKEQNNFEAIIDLWMDVIRKLAFFFFPAFMALFVLRYEFIVTLFTTKYLASVPIFAVNLFAIVLGIALHMHILRLFDRLKYFRLKLYLVLIPITFGALNLGLSLGGLTGVAIAVVLIQTLDVGLTLVMVGKELGMSRGDLRRLRPLLTTSAATLIAAGATIAAKLVIASFSDLNRLIIGAAVFGIAYLVAAFTMGVVTDEEKAYLSALTARLWKKRSERIKMSSVHEA
ncbi:MAG: oligosaccharide flippase family protein [Acidobacteria bacterium]|nr:oligosaccharide flippase family protein [Acidobacteriota bacterium]